MIFRFSIWIIMLIGGTAGGYFLDTILFKNIIGSPVFHIVSFLAGIPVLYLVMRVSKNTGRTLAKYGRNGEVKRLDTNILVKQGIYGYMRHPMHLGLFLFPVAAALLTGSLSFLFIIVPAEIILMLVMIKIIEEPQAIRKFGEDYLEYMKQVPRFCFKIKITFF